MQSNESGYTLIGVLAVFTIISILGLSLVTLSVSSLKTSKVEHDDQSVFYIAEAGANYTYEALKEKTQAIYDSDVVRKEEDFLRELAEQLPRAVDDDPEIPFEPIHNEQPKVEISVTQLSDEQPNTFTISSTGTINDQSRTVKQLFTVHWIDKYIEETVPVELPPFAVFTSHSIEISNSGKVDGNIGVINDQRNSVTVGNGNSFRGGYIYVPNGDTSIVNNKRDKVKELNPMYGMPILPQFPEFPEATLTFDNTQVIDVANEDKNIVVDTLNLTNGHVELKGNGVLNIYVKDKINISNGSSINRKGDIRRLNIFYKGNDDLNLDGGQGIWGSVFAESADIHVTGGGVIHGNIFTGGEDVTIRGGPNASSQLIFAPNAHVKIFRGGEVNGIVLSNSFSTKNGGEVAYDKPLIMTGPISPDALNYREGNGESPRLIETGAKPDISGSPVREIE